MNATKKAANAIAGKTARACDSCLRRRARWYCAADDAFLCQGCDSTVHSANQLASRHERVRLEKASSGSIDNHAPSWHQGFTKKARTPRHGKPMNAPPKQEKDEMEAVAENITSFLPALVPEMGSEEGFLDENEEQLLYRVPMLDPFDAELCCVPNGMVENNNKQSDEGQPCVGVEGFDNFHESSELDNFHGFLPSDMELAEFAADVETLLGTGLDDESCGIEGLGLLDCKEEEEDGGLGDFFEERKVKVEEDGVGVLVDSQLDLAMDMTRETIDWNFDYDSPTDGAEEEKAVCAVVETAEMNGDECKVEEVKRKILLRLDYEAVIAAWDSQGSPWTNGSRPELNPDDGWPDFMGLCSTSSTSHPYLGMGGQVRCSDGGREARVSRYREKRRTRLFSKKIRYEVRKLNAEKRPRMKGRFVKRTSFPGNSFPNYMMNK